MMIHPVRIHGVLLMNGDPFCMDSGGALYKVIHFVWIHAGSAT